MTDKRFESSRIFFRSHSFLYHMPWRVFSSWVAENIFERSLILLIEDQIVADIMHVSANEFDFTE